MNVMAGTTTPTLHTVDFFYGKNPNNELDSLFVFKSKKKKFRILPGPSHPSELSPYLPKAMLEGRA